MNKHNCWDFMKCGRGPEGDKVDESGLCPAAAETAADGLNGGINGGRICWVIGENGCKDMTMFPDLKPEDCCFQCEFRFKVKNEEGLLNVCNATGFFLSINKRKQPR